MSTTFERPREIIGYCLAPLGLEESSDAYKETFRRLEHVVKTLQVAAGKANQPVSVDFSQMRTLTINEEAHGQQLD
jgi:hypothetical protein